MKIREVKKENGKIKSDRSYEMADAKWTHFYSNGLHELILGHILRGFHYDQGGNEKKGWIFFARDNFELRHEWNSV